MSIRAKQTQNPIPSALEIALPIDAQVSFSNTRLTVEIFITTLSMKSLTCEIALLKFMSAIDINLPTRNYWGYFVTVVDIFE